MKTDKYGQVSGWQWYLIPVIIGLLWGALGAYQIYLWSVI